MPKVLFYGRYVHIASEETLLWVRYVTLKHRTAVTSITPVSLKHDNAMSIVSPTFRSISQADKVELATKIHFTNSRRPRIRRTNSPKSKLSRVSFKKSNTKPNKKYTGTLQKGEKSRRKGKACLRFAERKRRDSFCGHFFCSNRASLFPRRSFSRIFYSSISAKKGAGNAVAQWNKGTFHSFHFANKSWDNELNDRVLSPDLPAVVYRVICAVTFCLVKRVLFAKDLILPPLCKV